MPLLFRLGLVTCALLLLVTSARSEPFTVAHLTIQLPDGAFTQAPDGSLRGRDGATTVKLIEFPTACQQVIPHVAGEPDSRAEPATGAPATWYPQRVNQQGVLVYCRDLVVGSRALAIASSAQELERIAAVVTGAVEAAITGQPPPTVTPPLPAGLDYVALPGTSLVLALPAGAYHSDGQVLSSRSGMTRVQATGGPHECDGYLRELAAGHPTEDQIVPATVPSNRWAQIRIAMSGIGFEYCRTNGADPGLLVTVSTLAESELAPVLAAIDAAIPPPAPTAFSVPGVGTLHVPGDRFWILGTQLATIDGRIVRIATAAGPCERWRGDLQAAGWTGEPFDAPAAWDRTRMTHEGVVRYCRDTGALAITLELTQPAGSEPAQLMQAIDSIAASAPPAVPTPAQVSAPSPALPGADASFPAYSQHEVEPYRYREPATAGSTRFGVMVGEVDPTAMPAMPSPSTTALALHVRVPPRFATDLDSGVVIAAGASAGIANGDMLGDAHADAGYGIQVGRLMVAGLVGAGGDRIAGGFDPVTGAYFSLTLAGRLGLSVATLVGEMTWTSSTGVDEQRASGGLLVHVGRRVFELGVAWQDWPGHGSMLGGVLAVAP